MPEKTPQPSDEFDGALGEPLEARDDAGHDTPCFFHALRAFCQDFFAAPFLCRVGDAGFGESGFKKDHQIMEQAEEHRLGGFGGDTAGP
jgi:hypothetical protein